MSGPLAGATVALEADGAAWAVATELLGGLGATVRSGPGAALTGTAREWPGVSGGAVEVAAGYATAAAALLAALTGRDVRVDRDVVAAWVLAPAVVADTWPQPRAPLPVGDGAVAADLGAPGDDEQFAALRATLPPGEADDPEVLAAAAQAWRLPVTAFAPRPAGGRVPPLVRTGSDRPASGASRRRPASPSLVRTGSDRPASGASRRRPASPPLAGVVVCDLTAMWAGPLATQLLAALGAEVVRVDPAVRPDGLRGSPLYRTLNAGKRIVDLDLRTPDGRAALDALLARADVVADSFSRRVMPGFGLSAGELAARHPDLLVAAVRAFPPGPRADWRAYGAGIHAAAGLGTLGGRFVHPSVSYPDPLGGFLLCAAILSQLVARERLGRVVSAEVSLLDAVLPLARFDQPARLADPIGADVRARLRAGFGPVFELRVPCEAAA